MKTFALYLIFTMYLLFLVPVAHAQISKSYDDKNGNPTFIEFKDATTLTNAEYSVLPTAVNSQDDIIILQRYLKPNTNTSFKSLNQETDELGFSHRKYQQFFKGIKVEYSTYTVHAKGEKVTVINGKYTAIDANTSITPLLNEANAIEKAIKHIDINKTIGNESDLLPIYSSKDTKGELVFIQINTEPRLAYKCNIFSIRPLRRNLVYVDAINGNILFVNSLLHECFPVSKFTKGYIQEAKTQTNTINKTQETLMLPMSSSLPTRYSGKQTSTTDLNNNSYRLRDYNRGQGIETYNAGLVTSEDINVIITNSIDFTSSDNNWTNYANAQKDNAALDVHIGTQNTYDFFKNTFNRNSIDGKGYKLRSYVHFLKGLGENYINAFWTGEEMFYGDGDGVNFDPLVSQDVVSHELGHGFCQNTANLVYEGESGALNEALSDIWGATIENFYYPNKKTWLLGEDFDLTTHTGFRNMANPKTKGNPNTYRGDYWVWNMVYDYGGVHLNSSVINHWYYLLAQGSTGINDFGVNYEVIGIGIMDAAKIVYRAETQYLSSQSDFLDFRVAAIKSATDIFGAVSSQVRAVINAFAAVGLSSPLLPAQQVSFPTNCTIPSNQLVCGIALTADNIYSGVYAASGVIANSSTNLFLQNCNFNFTGDLYVGFMQVKSNSSLFLEAGKAIKIESGVRSNGLIGGLKVPYGSTFKARICSANNNTLATTQTLDETVLKETEAIKSDMATIESIEEITKPSLLVYPNPVTTEASIEFELKESTKLNLFLTDVTGKKSIINVMDECLKEAGSYKASIDCSSLKDGVYLMVLNTNKGSVSKKIAVSK